MVLNVVKRAIPRPVKHPILTCSQFYWDMREFPGMSLGDMTIIKSLLTSIESPKLRIFEWGSGTSTAYYSKFLKSIGRDFEWHSSENSAAWRDRTEKKVRRAKLADQVQVHLSEFPAFWELPGFTWDEPVPPSSVTESPNAVRYVNMPLELTGQYDVMIVDGRYRRRCLLVAKQVLAPGGVAFLHDAQKPQYHSSLSEFSHSKFITTGTMPGSSQQSTIALCCMGEDSLVDRYLSVAAVYEHL